MRLALALALAALAVLAPSPVAACATCGCGDPTLTVMGAEPPFAGRVRLSLRARYRFDAFGRDPDARTELHEGVIFAGASWAPNDRLVLAAELPTVVRHVRWPSLAQVVTAGPGDAELRGRAVLLRDRAFAPEHLLGVQAGVRLPTSLDQVGPNGRLPVEAQTGSGAVSPIGGLFYTHLADPLAFFASATVTAPVASRFDEAPGPSLMASVALQRRIDRQLTVRAGADFRFDAPATIRGRLDPASDHLALFVTPELLWAPAPDWVLSLGVRLPIWQHSEQGRSEGPYAIASVVIDV